MLYHDSLVLGVSQQAGAMTAIGILTEIGFIEEIQVRRAIIHIEITLLRTFNY